MTDNYGIEAAAPTVPATETLPKLTSEQYKLLLYTEQNYWRRGSLPSYEDITSDGVLLDEALFYETWSNPRFLDGLRGRGIPEHLLAAMSGTSPDYSPAGKSAFDGRVLTEQQLTVANVMLDVLDKRSRLKKLTELGVSTAEYNSWLRDPLYRRYCLERSEGILEEAQPIAHLSLVDRVTQGDLSAIKYLNSMTGRYREKTSAGVEVNVNNIQAGSDLLIKVVEVIQRHVKDPDLLSAIGDDILKIANPEPITKPQYNVIEGGTVKYGIA